MEKVNETYGEGNAYDFGARIYDSRLERWLSLDPLMKNKNFASPYLGIANNPVLYIDIGGEDEFITIIIINKRTGETETRVEKVSTLFKKVQVNTPTAYTNDYSIHYEYYNIYHQFTIVINEDGTETESSGETTLGIAPVYSRHPITQWIGYNRMMDGEWEGNGDKARSGGMRLSSEDGGISPVKTKCKNGLDGTPIGDLLTALGATGMAKRYKDLTKVDFSSIKSSTIQSIKEQSKDNQKATIEEQKQAAKIRAVVTYPLFPGPNQNASPGAGTIKDFADQKKLDKYKKDNPTHTVTIIPKI